jgi:hypothetical protein
MAEALRPMVGSRYCSTRPGRPGRKRGTNVLRLRTTNALTARQSGSIWSAFGLRPAMWAAIGGKAMPSVVQYIIQGMHPEASK